MKYLKDYSKNRLRGISFTAYLAYLDATGGIWSDANQTKYLLGLITHPLNETVCALEVRPEHEQYLDSDYQSELVDYDVMNGMGWFTQLPE